MLSGEEWYGINGRQIPVRPGQFLILNDDQPYCCHIHPEQTTRIVSIFFKKEFAREVFTNAIAGEASSLDDPADTLDAGPEFFQTLYSITPALQLRLHTFITHLDTLGYDRDTVDEYLVFFLRHLLETHRSELTRSAGLSAVRPSTKRELFKRLCIAKDLLHSSFHQPLDLQTISRSAALSVPQLVRQFKAAYHTTPHRYLVKLRLGHATHLLTTTNLSIRDITWQCGFEDSSAFCRAFKSAFGVQPETFRLQNPATLS